FELASILLPRLESYSLASLVRFFGVEHRRQHRALPDAEVTRQLYLRLVARALELDQAVLREIVALTARTMWPLRTLCRASGERRWGSPGGARIRDQLAAKLGAGEASLDVVLAREELPPLAPTGERRRLDVAALVAEAEPGGSLAAALAPFEDRPEQR